MIATTAQYQAVNGTHLVNHAVPQDGEEKMTNLILASFKKMLVQILFKHVQSKNLQILKPSPTQ